MIAGIAWVNSRHFSTPVLISFRGVTSGSVAKCWLFSQAIAWRIRKIISYFILTYITGERIENKQVLVNKSMPVVTSSGLQPGNVAVTIFLWFRHVILRPYERERSFDSILNPQLDRISSGTTKFKMFDINLCIWQNSKLQRHIWVCNQKFVVLSEVFF